MKKIIWVFFCLLGFAATAFSDDSEIESLLADRFFYPKPAAPDASLISFKDIKGNDIKDGIYQLPLLSKNWHRGSFDFRVHWDVSTSPIFNLDLSFSNPDAVGSVTLYFQSGSGWYSMMGKEVPMKDRSIQRFTFQTATARTEGHPGPLSDVSVVRLAIYPKAPADFSCRFIALTDETPAVLLVMEDRLFNPANDYIQRFQKIYQSVGIRCRAIAESELNSDLLKSFAVVLLPYQEKLKNKTTELLKNYALNGGFLIMFYSQPNDLMKTLGFQPSKYYKMANLNMKLSAMKFQSEYRADLKNLIPEKIRQSSHNIQAAFPLEANELDDFLAKAKNRPQIAAWWYDDQDKKTRFPAILTSGRGIFVSHVFYGDDSSAKADFLLAQSLKIQSQIQKNFILSQWRRIFKIGALPQFEKKTAPRDANKKTLANILPRLKKEGWSAADIVKILDGQFTGAEFVKFNKFRGDLESIRAALSKEYIASIGSKKIEARFWWEHSGAGAYPGDWDRTMRELSEAGFNGVITNMIWGGGAYYKSDYLPTIPAYKEWGDQVEQAVKAGKKYGIEVHIWKVNFNMIRSPKEFIDKMRAEGRTQKSISGEEKDWLCPSHPENQKLEIESMLEVAKKYKVDGVHFDYIRYDGSQYCFCEGCQKRFSDHYFKLTGKRITDLPKEIRQDTAIRDAFDHWRADQITTIVRGLRERVDRECPQVKISAAVFRDYPNCKTSVAQDWVRWVHEGYLDFVCPMNYTNSNEVFAGWLKTQNEALGNKIPVYPGIGLWSSSSRQESDQTALQIKMARDSGAKGFTIFSLNSRTAAEQLQDFKAGPTREKAVTPHSLLKK